MKRGTIEHPKMLTLAAELGIPRYAAVGILESLWHWASRYAIQGDIGKWKDSAIAGGVGWTEEPGRLIEALIASGWVERVDGPARLVIHDIMDHADNTWRQNLIDAGLRFWNGAEPRGKGQGFRSDKNKPQASVDQPQDNLKNTSSAPPQPEPVARARACSQSQRKTKACASGLPPDPRVKLLLDEFHAQHVLKTGEKPKLDGKAGALAKKLVAIYPDERLRVLIAKFFASEDPFVRRAGRGFGIFYSQIERLATAQGPPPALPAGLTDDELEIKRWREEQAAQAGGTT